MMAGSEVLVTELAARVDGNRRNIAGCKTVAAEKTSMSFEPSFFFFFFKEEPYAAGELKSNLKIPESPQSLRFYSY